MASLLPRDVTNQNLLGAIPTFLSTSIRPVGGGGDRECKIITCSLFIIETMQLRTRVINKTDIKAFPAYCKFYIDF